MTHVSRDVPERFTSSEIIKKYSDTEYKLDLRTIAVLMIAHLDRLSAKYSPSPRPQAVGVTVTVTDPIVPLAVEIRLSTFSTICDLLQYAQVKSGGTATHTTRDSSLKSQDIAEIYVRSYETF